MLGKGSFYNEFIAKLKTYDHDTSEIGYFAVVDAECPPGAQQHRMDFPAFPTMGTVGFKDLSCEDQQKYIKRHGRPPAEGKLGNIMSLSLKQKNDYGIHIALLEM